jgi:SMODS and SLOG-associating 2TM effector domain 1/Protein of unknown function (DUF4231)
MGDRDTHTLVDAVWSHQSVWSQTANLLKARIDRLRSLMLALAIVSAVLTTLAAQVTTHRRGGQALALAAGVAVAMVPLVRARLGRDAVSRWTRARAVSEQLKAEVYRFLANVAPFRGADRDGQLEERTRRVRKAASDLLEHTAGVAPAVRDIPAVRDADSYVTARLQPQIGWYRSRSERLSRRLAWARRVEVALSVLGALLAVWAAVRKADTAAAWVAVVTTVTAAVSSHVAASRWEYQLVEYLRTAAELEELQESWLSTDVHDEAAADALVEHCEHVVSIQNDGWMAKWTADSS